MFMAKVKAFWEEEPSSSSKQVHLPTLLNAYSLCMAFAIAHQCLHFRRWCIQMEAPPHPSIENPWPGIFIGYSFVYSLTLFGDLYNAIDICREITLVSVTCFHLFQIHVLFLKMTAKLPCSVLSIPGNKFFQGQIAYFIFPQPPTPSKLCVLSKWMNEGV